MKKIGRYSVVIAIGFFLLVAIVPITQAQEAPVYGGELVLAEYYDIETLDVHRAVSSNDVRIVSIYGQGLFSINTEWKVVPLLVTTWEASEDLLAYTFHLREGVKFHNGREMKASDVAFSFQRMMDPDTNSPRYTDFQVNIESISIVDERTIVFRLKKMFAPFISLLASRAYIICPEVVNDENEMTEYIGTGPFKVVEWKRGEYISFEKFEDYWNPSLPYLDKVTILIVPDDAARFAAVRIGEVHIMTEFPFPFVAQLASQGIENLKIVRGINNPPTWLVINLRNPCTELASLKVRQAIAYALDKSAMVKSYALGNGRVLNQGYPEGTFWHVDVPDIYAEPNLEKAKELLEEAGYPDGFYTEIIVAPIGDLDEMGEVLQATLKSIGIRAEIRQFDYPALADRLRNYDYCLSTMGASPKYDPHMFYSFWTSDSPASFEAGGFSDPTYDALVDAAASIIDPDARKMIYRDVVQRLQDKLGTILVYMRDYVWGVRAEVKNLVAFVPDQYAWADGGVAYWWLAKAQ